MKILLYNAPSFLNEYIGKIEDLLAEKSLNLPGSQIEVSFVSRQKISDLNKKYFKREYYTDVMAFPLVFTDRRHAGKKASTKKGLYKSHADVRGAQKNGLLGEVYICEEVVKDNANKFGVPFKNELLEVLIHGCLHILGYEHKGSIDRPEPGDEKMFNLQKKLLKNLVLK